MLRRQAKRVLDVACGLVISRKLWRSARSNRIDFAPAMIERAANACRPEHHLSIADAETLQTFQIQLSMP